MVTLQELITRGKFIMSDAPSRLKVFEAVDGRRNVKAIASLTGRHENNVRRDLSMLEDAGLIQVKDDASRLPVYEKVPLARTIPLRYFEPIGKRPEQGVIVEGKTGKKAKGRSELAMPTEAELLEIAKGGEDQLYEFKAQGVDVQKLTKEIAAMLNTSQGGIIFYGIEDDGTIVGTDLSRQKLDQPLQNSIRNTIRPTPAIKIGSVQALGTEVIVIVVPPWNRRDVYQYQDKFLIRKGTNVFAATAEEVKALFNGQHIV